MAIEKGVGFPITAIDQFSGEFNRLKSKVTEVTSVIGRLNGVLSFLGTGITSFSVTAAFGAMIQSAEAAAVAQRKLDAVIRATGNTTGYTADQLSRLADSLARTSSFDDEAFREATATLMRFGNIGGANLEKVLKLSADYAALTGGDLVSAAEKLGRALSNPAEGLSKLERNFGALAPEVEAAIKQQARMGDASGALSLAIEALQKKIGGADESMNSGLTGSIKQLRKAISELMEVGGHVADNSAVTAFLDGLSARLRGLKDVMEGDWTMKLLAIMGGQKLLAALGNAKPAAITPSGGGRGILDLGIVDEGLDSRGAANARIVLERIEAQKKAREEWLKNEDRLRQLDAAGWVKYIETTIAEYEEGLRAQAKLTEEHYDAKDKIREIDLEGQEWLSKNAVKIAEEETRQIEALRQSSLMSFWNEASDLAGNFFSDLVMNGRDAFDNLRKWVKQLFADMVALFAKRWVLNLAAGGSFMGAAGSAMAGGLGTPGDGSLAGGLLGSFGSILPGGEIAAAIGNVANMGASFLGAGGSLASTIGSLASFIPTIALAATAIAAVVSAISRRGGGPKEGGSFIGSFDASGALTGTSSERLYTPSSGDSAAREWGTSAATAYFQTLQRFGGSSSGITFGFGYDQDPRGSADSRVTALVRGAGGQTLLNSTQSAGRDDEDFQRAIGLQTRRAILAALQASELPEAIAAILRPLDAVSASAEDIDKALTAAEKIAQILDALADLRMPGLDLEVLKGFQRAGEELETTFTRVAGLWTRYQDLFLTDAEKLGLAQGAVDEAFQALGIAVPSSMEEFKRLVDSLDLTTEAGRTAFETLMGVAPAFASVSNAARGMLADFDSIMGRLRGPAYTAGQNQAGLEAATRQFMAGNAWTTGMDWRYVAQQITTITREDFQAYSGANQALINQILGYTSDLQGAAEPVATFTNTMASASGAVDDYARSLEQARLSLRGWATDKLLGNMSALSSEDKYAFALQEYQRALGSGDIGYFRDSADALLGIGRDRFASGTEYTDLFNRVLTDAEALGGFSLGRDNGTPASIDQMRAELAAELRISNQKAAELQMQVRDLIATLRETSREQTTATRDAADQTARAVRSAVESVAR